MKIIIVIFSILLASANLVLTEEIEAVLIHPAFDQPYLCSEHWDGQFKDVGDALGADCVVHKFEKRKNRSWLRSFKTNGYTNEDWYGWDKNVLAPFDGTVVKINENTTVNKPGFTGKGMAAFIILKREDGVMALLAHIDKLKVKIGDTVKAGQVLAQVGNNGQSWNPHIHIGVWKNNKPMQVRFDQKKMKTLFSSL